MNEENQERLLRGPKGERGEPGVAGPGMPKRIRYSVVFLFVLAVLLAAAGAGLAVQGEISSRASVVQLCQAGNESRAQQVTLWTHLVAISQAPSGETVAQRAQRLARTRAFLVYVRKVFAPRNCAASFGP